MDLARQRLVAQRLVGSQFATLAEAVRWFGAVQAQDYPAAAWAVGQRTAGATAATIDEALASGAILRTHILRPTWHFVVPEDIRWMLALTAPRVKISLRTNDRRTGVDAALITHGKAVLAAALCDGQRLTRAELVAALKQASIHFANSLGYTHLIIHAELDGLICSGGLRGRQQTYAVLDERIPPGPILTRDEALAELARRYFRSHGPATVADFAWWSGLTVVDTQRGLNSIKEDLQHHAVAGVSYWMAAPTASIASSAAPLTHLLPNFDEFLVAYKDRRAAVDSVVAATDEHWAVTVINNHVVVRDGQVIGTWKRTLSRDTVEIAPRLATELSERERAALASAAARYGKFHGRQAHLSW